MRVLLAALLLTGCSSSGNALVVVSVAADHALVDLVELHADIRTGDQARAFAVTPASGDRFEIPPTRTFAVEVPEAYAGRFELILEARGADGVAVAEGAGATTTSPGQRSDLEIHLGGTSRDGGDDGAS